jgi:DNA-binding MarR family transcriptional regulator
MLNKSHKYGHKLPFSSGITLIAIIMFSFLLLFSLNTQAQEVDIEIDQQPTGTADFTVENEVRIPLTGNITISSTTRQTFYIGVYPEEWVESFSPTEVDVTIQATVPFEGELVVPSNSVQKDHTFGIWVSSEPRDFGSEFEFTSSSLEGKQTFDIFIIQNRVRLDALTLPQPAVPNSTVTHYFKVINIGTTPDTFEIDVLNDETFINNGWEIQASDWSLDLGPGDEETLYVDIFIPDDVEGGTYNLDLEAASTETSSIQSISMQTNVEIPESPLPTPWWLSFWFISLIGFVAVGTGLAIFFGATEIGYYGLLSLFLPLYVRIKKKDVLNHVARCQIYGYIQANPGAHYNAIIMDLKMQNGVTAYHLQVLEREGYIKSYRDGMYKRFYPMEMKIEHKKLHLSHIQKSILHELHRHPGISQKNLAKLLDESKQVINYHVKILEDVGLIKCERGSRTTALFPAGVRYVEHEDTYEATDDGTASAVVRM